MNSGRYHRHRDRHLLVCEAFEEERLDYLNLDYCS